MRVSRMYNLIAYVQFGSGTPPNTEEEKEFCEGIVRDLKNLKEMGIENPIFEIPWDCGDDEW